MEINIVRSQSRNPDPIPKFAKNHDQLGNLYLLKYLSKSHKLGKSTLEYIKKI